MREPAARPVMALLTDFGTRDPYVGAMKGAALSVCADATLVDLTHDIAAHDVAEAARHLAAAAPYFPAGTAFVVVVDPGVGSVAAGTGGVGLRALVRRTGQRRADAGPHARCRDRRDHVACATCASPSAGRSKDAIGSRRRLPGCCAACRSTRSARR